VRFRVSVAESSPVHEVLEEIPECRRGAVLVGLAEQALSTRSMVPAVERIAAALEVMAGRVTPLVTEPVAPAVEEEPEEPEDPRLQNLDRDW